MRNRASGFYRVPAGAGVLWQGIAGDVPSGWTIIEETKDVFVMGCDVGDQTDVVDGDFEHEHHNPDSSGYNGSHWHKVRALAAGTGSASQSFQTGSNTNSAGPGHGHPYTSKINSSSVGDHSHPLLGTKVAEVYPPYARMYWITSASDAPLPVGGIIMWDDTADALGQKFKGSVKICDGKNGTPDLREKFVYGASVDGDIGSGGSETHVHENEDTDSAGPHIHSVALDTTAAGSVKNIYSFETGTVSAGGHIHNVSKNLPQQDSHLHNVKDTKQASSLPPYLKLYFVMRVL